MIQSKLITIIKDCIKDQKNITLNTVYGSKSMRPLITDDTKLFVKAVNQINVGDLLLLDFYTELCCHRVIKIKNGIYTKGDNNPTVDYEVKTEQILGKVYGIKRNGKFYDFRKKTLKIYGCLIAYMSKLSANYDKEKNIYKKICYIIMKFFINGVIARGEYESI